MSNILFEDTVTDSKDNGVKQESFQQQKSIVLYPTASEMRIP